MKRLFLVPFLALLCCGQAQAAQTAWAYIVPSCGALIGSSLYKSGDLNAVTMDTTGKLCVSASVSASITTTATAANPGYTEGSSTNPISVDLSGHLRVIDTNSAAALADLATIASGVITT